jgi:hypothetical protein
MRSLVAAFLFSVFLAQYSYAQSSPPPPAQPGLSAAAKAEMDAKEDRAKNTDEAYKATLKHIPDANGKVDPWATVRTSPKK